MNDGRFKPGNPGRPKGVKNKFKLTTIREALQEAEIDLGPLILKMISELGNPESRITFLLRLYSYVEPKTSKIINEGGAETQSTGERPKDDVVDDLIHALTKSIKEKNGSPIK